MLHIDVFFLLERSHWFRLKTATDKQYLTLVYFVQHRLTSPVITRLALMQRVRGSNQLRTQVILYDFPESDVNILKERLVHYTGANDSHNETIIPGGQTGSSGRLDYQTE